jgi:hypothetical protein
MSAVFWNRVLSLLVAAVSVWFMTSFGEVNGGVGRLLGVMIIAMVCIWFGEEVGEYTGFFRGHSITTKTPGCMVVAVGWIFLIVISLIGVLMINGKWAE